MEDGKEPACSSNPGALIAGPLIPPRDAATSSLI